MPIEINMPNKLYYGKESLTNIKEAISHLDINHLFVLLSKRSKGEVGKLIKKVSPCPVTFSTNLYGEPTTNHVTQNVKRFHESGADGVLAVGGGSVIDLAKAVAVFAKNQELSLENIHLMDRISRYPLIAIPTTAGSGSEATKVFVITDAERNIKYNPSHPSFLPDVAILDPKLLETLPFELTVNTGIDALAHAIEAYVSTKATLYSDFYATAAIELLSSAIKSLKKNSLSIKDREKMLLGSHLAGIAFSNSSTNLAHATARALGTKFDLSHGLSVALMLPHVVEFGYNTAKERYKKIAKLLGVENVSTYLYSLNTQLNVYKIAQRKINKKNFTNEIETLTSNTLLGNGILTNRKIPTKKDINKIYSDMLKKVVEG